MMKLDVPLNLEIVDFYLRVRFPSHDQIPTIIRGIDLRLIEWISSEYSTKHFDFMNHDAGVNIDTLHAVSFVE